MRQRQEILNQEGQAIGVFLDESFFGSAMPIPGECARTNSNGLTAYKIIADNAKLKLRIKKEGCLAARAAGEDPRRAVGTGRLVRLSYCTHENVYVFETG